MFNQVILTWHSTNPTKSPRYNATKRAAHTAKTMKHGSGAEISTVRPESYAKRFLEFMSNAFV